MSLKTASSSIAWVITLVFFAKGFAQNTYWQQRADYTITAELDDRADVIIAQAVLTYYNHSPHTLDRLYFHLYANAFQPESYYHHLYLANKMPVRFGINEAAGLGTRIDHLSVNGDSVYYLIDNTIMEVRLNEPLPPKGQLQVTMRFRTWFDDGGTMRRRQKMFRQYGVKHYNAVHWYPVVCVYDRYGWHTPQHLDKEYYAEFGNFDVKLTLPQHYIVGATGLLVNEEEVLPSWLKKRLQLSNFKDKPLYQPPSVIVPESNGQTKTWHYIAENVHNFAFTADPTYRIGEIIFRNTKIQVLAREPHASRWQEIPTLVALMMRLYSDRFGAYEYPSLVVADAQDGTEYGMMAIVNGFYPHNISLIAHELAHQWFYGMVANNETYRAYMDEGFAEFLTVWMLEQLYGGKEVPQSVDNRSVTRRLLPYNFGFARLMYPYLEAVHKGFDKPLNTHSNDFNGGIGQTGGYGLVYSKGGVMLMQLRYVLGEELFYKALAEYVARWKFKHPYPEDFRQSIISSTGINLNWFFDQWTETTKTTDYAICKIVRGKNPKEYRLTLLRKGEMQMPLELTLTTRSGTTYNFYIPNEWWQKPTQAQVLPKWTGWGLVFNRRYTATVELDAPPVYAEIDTSQTLADIDRSNNIWQAKLPLLQWEHAVENMPYWRSWQYFWRPVFWYNRYDGGQIGLRITGDYFEGRKNWQLTAGWNTGQLQNTVMEGQEKAHRKWWAKCSVSGYYFGGLWQEHLTVFWNAGAYFHQIGISRTWRRRDQYNPNYRQLHISHTLLYRPSETDLNYLWYPSLWLTGVANTSLNFSLRRYYEKKSHQGSFHLLLRTPFWVTANSYGFLEGEWKHAIALKWSEFRLRGYARFSQGATRHRESNLYAAGANPEEIFNNSLTQAALLSPFTSKNINRLHVAGGLNIRGFALYAYDSLQKYFSGQHGFSASAEWDFSKAIKFRSNLLKHRLRLNSYLFADAGAIYNMHNTIRWLANVGVGAQFTFNTTGKYRREKTIVLRLENPLWLSEQPIAHSNLFNFMIGVGKSL